jgi:hypothetical protein
MIKRISLYLPVFFLLSCSVSSNTDQSGAALYDSTTNPEAIKEYGRYYSDTTFVNNRQSYQITTRDLNEDYVLLLATSGSNTALLDTLSSSGLSDITFPDFNKDGNLDIMLTYMGNNSTYFLYLFDPASNEFKKITGFENYPEAIQLRSNKAYYYSYRRAGCADMNWVSYLFKIEDFKSVRLGEIYGQGCEPEQKETKPVIEVYKMAASKEEREQLLEKLPYSESIPDYGDKWAFIEKYWNEKHTLFQ